MIPTIGRIVHYRLRKEDADAINRRRQDAQEQMHAHRANATGVQVHVGNAVNAGDVFPMIITQVWGSEPTSPVNGQVFLDGKDLLWATSVACRDGTPLEGTDGTFSWPTRN